MNQKITGFHKDVEDHWVADLDCGHRQHMRHDPPWMNRPWILTEEGRLSKIGVELNCKRCDESGAAVAEAVRMACYEKASQSYEDAGIQGLCEEGRWEVALDAMKSMDLKPVIEQAIRRYVAEQP